MVDRKTFERMFRYIIIGGGIIVFIITIYYCVKYKIRLRSGRGMLIPSFLYMIIMAFLHKLLDKLLFQEK